MPPRSSLRAAGHCRPQLTHRFALWPIYAAPLANLHASWVKVGGRPVYQTFAQADREMANRTMAAVRRWLRSVR